ncbi:uncharacterized protein A1O9_00688 [Exophiala aquamarina CBS 119918]|uniref:B30.2/SPRY domain-containing protein n=1 Tax=Exophiala aquamarina CBS 119918 TaxID=1182545 RepID=A0A072Q484_9EURO|nr:uncharacterized protein A1O9_00688 [Exophiala aquamarina CBS 119918]KEF62715.1 hypothetical protein A1O9_00688 [Exophiala aquamarina CBS 119918]
MPDSEGADQRDYGGVSELQDHNLDPANGSQNNKRPTRASPIPDDEKDISEYSRVRLLTQAAIEWNKQDCSSILYLSSQGLKVTVVGPRLPYREDYRGYAVRATKPFAPRPGPGKFRYFEVEVINGGKRNLIYIGFSARFVPLHRMPGWDPGSVGYHGDDGRVFQGKPFADLWGAGFRKGAIVGCGITPSGDAFFTINGFFQGIPRPIQSLLHVVKIC